MKVVRLEFAKDDGTIKAAVVAEVADTPDLRRVGLSNRDTLPGWRGMFFDKAGAFWMKDVNFPLDLLFVDTAGTVLQKHAMHIDKRGDTLYRPDSAYAAHAIELPHGFVDKYGIVLGDVVQVKRI